MVKQSLKFEDVPEVGPTTSRRIITDEHQEVSPYIRRDVAIFLVPCFHVGRSIVTGVASTGAWYPAQNEGKDINIPITCPDVLTVFVLLTPPRHEMNVRQITEFHENFPSALLFLIVPLRLRFDLASITIKRARLHDAAEPLFHLLNPNYVDSFKNNHYDILQFIFNGSLCQ